VVVGVALNVDDGLLDRELHECALSLSPKVPALIALAALGNDCTALRDQFCRTSHG